MSTNDRFHSLEESVNSRFDDVDARFKVQDEKLDQILLLLNKFTPNPEQEK